MKRTAYFSLILITATGISLAQTQPSGGWRRIGDPPPAQVPAPEQQAPLPPVDQEDPSQPVARSDEYGQSQAPQPPQVSNDPQPQLNRRPSGSPPPAYGLPSQVAIPAGTFVTVRVNQPLSSDRNQTGDFFSATLVQPLVVDGIVVAQRGQTVTGQVTEAYRPRRGSGPSRLGLELTGLTLADGTQANVQSQLVTRKGRSTTGQDVGTVAATTGIGAAIGAAADWGRGAAIGAGAGAVAGLVGVLLTPSAPTVVYPETALTFRLDSRVNVNLTRAPYAFRYVSPNEYDRPVQTAVGRPVPRPVPPRPPVVYAPGPYVYPYPYPYGYYPYYGGFGFGVVIRGGGYGRRW
jgi:hypothetical protein